MSPAASPVNPPVRASTRALVIVALLLLASAGAEAQQGAPPAAPVRSPAPAPACTGIVYDETFPRSASPVVLEVSAESPAGEAGIQVGDIILSVDGKDAKTLEQLFPGRSGTIYTLRIQRGAEIREVEVGTGMRLVAAVHSGTPPPAVCRKLPG
jgi:S1-C subfamily serine protease